MRKNRILVIPGAFVPVNDTVTLLSYKHLRGADAEIDVIALEGAPDEGIRKNLEQDEAWKKFHVETCCRYDQAVATLQKKNVISGIFYTLKYCLTAAKKGIEGDYDVIYTSSIPAFTHLAGYWIKKKKGDRVRWIASFSDPLIRSPYKKDEESFREYSLLEKIGFFVYIGIYMNGGYEKICQKAADHVVTICEEQRDFMCAHAPDPRQARQKSLVVPLNYIRQWPLYQQLLQRETTPRHRPLVFAHFGRIYGLRKIDRLLEAIRQCKEDNPNLAREIVFVQVGQILPRYLDQIRRDHLEDCFQVRDKVSYEQAMAQMKQSDGLLLLDTIMPDDQIQPYLPSKSLEYLLLRKPLLILTTPKSPAYRLFTRYGYPCVMNDVAQLKQRIQQLIAYPEAPDSADLSALENEEATRELVRLLSQPLDA